MLSNESLRFFYIGGKNSLRFRDYRRIVENSFLENEEEGDIETKKKILEKHKNYFDNITGRKITQDELSEYKELLIKETKKELNI